MSIHPNLINFKDCERFVWVPRAITFYSRPKSAVQQRISHRNAGLNATQDRPDKPHFLLAAGHDVFKLKK